MDRLDFAPAGFLTVADDGRILDANTTLAAWLGRSREEIQAATLDLLLSPGARVFYQTHFFPLLKLEGRAEEIYLTLLHASGELVPVLANAIRRQEGGSAWSDWVIVRTGQRDLFEEKLLVAKKAAEAASQAKSKFLSMMSHELRTPLQSIAIFSEILSSGGHGALSARQAEDVRGIEGATQSLVTLIDDILNFARLESGKVEVRIETVSLGAMLSRAEALLRPRIAEAGLVFSFDPHALGTDVRADPDRLQQILLNLLTNAIKFTGPGGRVRVDVEPGPQVRIRVRDTGSGIPAEHFDRIFEPFVQVDRARVPGKNRGVGLGLSISRELARAMGGDLAVESRVGEGSTFTVSLPAPDASGG